MGRPPKTHLQLVTEKKSHRTKAELEARKKGEEQLLTGTSLKEWPDTKAAPVAHKEFSRLKKLLKTINHDDALYEAVINRYCMLISECKDLENVIRNAPNDLEELAELRTAGEIDPITYLDRKDGILSRMNTCDKAIMEKRKMLLQIERENIMTIMAALKAVPRKAPEKEKSGMTKFLERKANGSQ